MKYPVFPYTFGKNQQDGHTVDFTREPIIETIISPREGHKLLVKSSKSDRSEEYTVHAVEVISFGSALFFRSREGSRSFMLPLSDYEVIEVKEARMVLKNVSTDKPIKIGEAKEEKPREETPKNDNELKKGAKKRHGRKKKSGKEENSEEKKRGPDKKEASREESEKTLKNPSEESKLIPPPVLPIAFPPPPKIIGKTIPPKKAEEEKTDAPEIILPESKEKNEEEVS